MSGRISKPVSRKTRERPALAKAIKELGFLIIPCSICKKLNTTDCYKTMNGIYHYRDCGCRGRFCDSNGKQLNTCTMISSPGSSDTYIFLAKSITSEHERLRAEEKEVEEQLAEYQRCAAEAMIRLSHIRSQQESLSKRGTEIINHGLQSLNEEDESDMAGSKAITDMEAFDRVDVIYWNAIS